MEGLFLVSPLELKREFDTLDSLDTHTCCIRDKLELTPRNGWRLAAVYGYGYRLQQVATSAKQVDAQVAMAGPVQPQSLLAQDRGDFDNSTFVAPSPP